MIRGPHSSFENEMTCGTFLLRRKRMLKKANLNIRSDIENLDFAGLAEGDAETSRSTVSSTFLAQGGEYRMSYSESTEGGALHSDIRVSADGAVTVARRGAIESVLLFENGKEFNTVYTVPPYKFDMQVKTLRLRTSLSNEGGTIDILYLMTVGGASKRCRMSIGVEVVK